MSPGASRLGPLARVDIRVLGGFGIAVDDRPAAAAELRRRDPARLVKLLAITPGHRLGREQVLDALRRDPPGAAGSGAS